jgi:16S rRNA (guanine966-N2)-methyltransferase
MRIISGSLKGRSIQVPKNFAGRPTTDFAREGLFNVLRNFTEIETIQILDLFAGTGAFGIECLSRGAISVVFVDIAPLHARFISENLKTYNLKNGSVVKQDVFKFIKQTSSAFDFVFADPPYDLVGLEEIPSIILNSTLLRDNGTFVLEHGKRSDFSNHPNFIQERAYSNVRFSFFKK